MRRVVIMGAAGRDFHDFNVLFRDDALTQVVAFTAAQIPGISNRTYPAALAGPRYPNGIPIVSEDRLPELIVSEAVDEVLFAYSDLSHQDVMHRASLVLSRGADFRLAGPKATMLGSTRPVVAVCAARTGSGKSQTSRRVGQILTNAGLSVALVRHPMPYGDLERMRVQRFATLADIDAAGATIEEREEYEAPVRMGMVVYAGVDYADILHQAELHADVIIWDGGNNDYPFFVPDLMVTVVDPLRPGHEVGYHPGETNVRMADVVVVNKLDSATPASAREVVANVRAVNTGATIIEAASALTLSPGPALADRRVLVVDDGPSLTHGGLPFGAGMVAAQRAGATTFVDPRPYAVGSIAATYSQYPAIGPVLPAMGYGAKQLGELAETIRAVACDVVVIGTPIDLGRLIDLGHASRRVTFELEEIASPTMADVLAPYVARWRRSTAEPATPGACS